MDHLLSDYAGVSRRLPIESLCRHVSYCIYLTLCIPDSPRKISGFILIAEHRIAHVSTPPRGGDRIQDWEIRMNASSMTNRRGKRLVVLLIVGTLLVGGTMLYLRYFATFRFWFPPPVGTGPAGPAVPHEPFQSPWTASPVVLLGVGDSVTAGFGADPGLSYFERLAQNPADEFGEMRGTCLSTVFPKLSSTNISVSGSTSLEHWDEQVDPLEPFSPDTFGIVVITTGGNDLIHWYGRGEPKEGAMYGATLEQAEPWMAIFRTRLDKVLSKITLAFPGGCAIFLAIIYDPSDGVGDTRAAGVPPWPDFLAIHDAYNAIIADAAERHENVYLVNIRGAFLGHGVHCNQWWQEHYRPEDPHYWYFTNLEDPNNRGYDALRRLFLNEIAAALVPRPGVPGPFQAPEPSVAVGRD